MAEIAEHFQGKKVVKSFQYLVADTLEDSYDYSGVLLDDGSVVAARSEWAGPYSEATPDIDGQEPTYVIGEH